MAAGEVVKAGPVIDESDLPVGTVVTPAGRLSVARPYEETPPELPFTPAQLARMDEAITLASRTAALSFSVYIGDLGGDPRAGAERLHGQLPEPAQSVLIAVSPGQRVVEVVTGQESARRLPDRGVKLAVMSMVASFKEGDLAGGLVSGLRMLCDQAGLPPRH